MKIFEATYRLQYIIEKTRKIIWIELLEKPEYDNILIFFELNRKNENNISNNKEKSE